MARGTRGRTTAAVVFSAILNAAALYVLSLHAPFSPPAMEVGGPPEPIIPILITPRTPPTPAGPPAPIRLHRRPQRFAPPPEVTPLPVPPVQPAKPATGGPAVIHSAPLPESPRGDLRTTLRGSPVGCGNPDAVGLTQAEREYCYGQLGKGAKTASFPGLGLQAAKQAGFDRTAARKEAERRYKEAPVPSADHAGGIGSTAEVLEKGLGNDRPDATAPLPSPR